MNITQTTQIDFKPLEKNETMHPETDEAIHTAVYDLEVKGQRLGVKETVISQGRSIDRSLQTDDGKKYPASSLPEALIAAGHTVEYD